ncbi:MAG: family 20 glycosylhydrolase [Chthoniobacterales bacterium]|nr:family 20 glycosylhydrolase [Chthoniobacterales bacterium]
MIPSESRLIEWLDRMHSGGITTVIFEYEDRYPWQTFPGTFRKGYERTGWEKIWAHCKILGLEVIPLVQTYGHLEWLLKHEEWSKYRCDGRVNLLCPQHPGVRQLITSWLNEVAHLHPDARYIHIGMDEVYHMGQCPVCRKRAECSPQGTNQILLEHARFVCETVARLGKRPIVWGDMLQECPESGIGSLPPETVICEWNYRNGEGEDIPKLRLGGKVAMMGASAIRCNYPTWNRLVGALPERIENITRWKKFAFNTGDVSVVIHTVWARSRGLAAVYGPWEGWLPAFDAVIARESSDAIMRGMTLLQRGHDTGHHQQIEEAGAEMKNLHSSDPFEEQALRWWEIALRYYAELHVLFYRVLGQEELYGARFWQGADPDLVVVSEQVHDGLVQRLTSLEVDVRDWLKKNEWSDAEEFLEERIRSLRRVAMRVPSLR